MGMVVLKWKSGSVQTVSQTWGWMESVSMQKDTQWIGLEQYAFYSSKECVVGFHAPLVSAR